MRGEELAARHLIAHGYRVEARNLRTRHAEIDVLARRRRLWIAVEVKTRSWHDAPERAVAEAQHRRLVLALAALVPTLQPTPRALRVDVIAVRLRADRTPELRHFEGQTFAPPAR